jgi:hypothetical protein
VSKVDPLSRPCVLVVHKNYSYVDALFGSLGPYLLDFNGKVW